MHFDSKKASLLILGITSIACSRTMFLSFNDPEGPNLLIVMVLAVVVYTSSLAVYVYYPPAKQSGIKKLLVAISAQILLVTGLYLLLS